MSKKKTSNPSSADKNNQSLTLKVSSEKEEPRPKSKSETAVPDSGISVDDLPVEKDGTRVLATYDLEKPENCKGIVMLRVPVVSDEHMKELKVTVNIRIPFIETISAEEVEKDESCLNDKTGLAVGDTFYVITSETCEEYMEKIIECGCTVINDNDEDDHALLNALKSARTRPNGYYEDLCEYWYDGEIFHEKDVIWLSPFDPRYCPKFGEPIFVDFDTEKLEGIEPCDVKDVFNKGIVIENGRKVLTNEEKFDVYCHKSRQKLYETPTIAMQVWWLASEYAKTRDDIGIAMVCLGGKFYMPVFTFVNYNLIELESVIVLFNSVPCVPDHHSCVGVVRADIGNMPIRTWIRPHKGTIIDWARRRDQEVTAYRKIYDPEFDPYDDPYDDPTFGWMYEDGRDTGKNGNNPDSHDDDDDDGSIT